MARLLKLYLKGITCTSIDSLTPHLSDQISSINIITTVLLGLLYSAVYLKLYKDVDSLPCDGKFHVLGKFHAVQHGLL